MISTNLHPFQHFPGNNLYKHFLGKSNPKVSCLGCTKNSSTSNDVAIASAMFIGDVSFFNVSKWLPSSWLMRLFTDMRPRDQSLNVRSPKYPTLNICWNLCQNNSSSSHLWQDGGLYANFNLSISFKIYHIFFQHHIEISSLLILYTFI